MTNIDIADDNWTQDYSDEWKYVLAQDPGGTTGVALIRFKENALPQLVYLHEIKDGKSGFFDFFYGSMVGFGTDVVSVSEVFIEREGVHGKDITPLHIEGVQFALWGDDTVYQSPDLKALISDQWLKNHNLWVPGKRHQMDALKHALIYLRNEEEHTPTIKALSEEGEPDEPIAQPGEAEGKQLDKQQGGEPGDANEAAEAMQALADALAEAMAKMQEAMDGAGEAMEELIAELQDGPGNGPGGENAITLGAPDEEDNAENHKGDVQNRKGQLKLNGVFIGFGADE